MLSKRPTFPTLFLFLCTLHTSISLSKYCFVEASAEKEPNDTVCENESCVNEDLPPILECGLYMAESSIPHAGWGMYTAKPISKNDDLGPKDVVINIPDQEEQMGYRARLGKTLPEWVMSEYVWRTRFNGGNFEAYSLDTIISGFGMLANSHTGLVNVHNLGSLKKEGPKRTQPEAGAYSYHSDLTFRAYEDLPAGMELFVEYGDKWFSDRGHTFGHDLPLEDDFTEANELLNNFRDIVKSDFKSKESRDEWDSWRQQLKNDTSARILRAIPTELGHVERVLEIGTAMETVPNVVRSIEWLQQNGICLDHLEGGPSTIPNAGKGAFTSRFLPKGAIVAPAPLVHLHEGHMDLLLMEADNVVLWKGKNLFYNYVYTHPSTSLVFYPYAPATNMINHAPTKDKANVQLRWSAHQAHSEWMDLSTDELLEKNTHTGLMMEYIAIRDIAEGEEIMIDYGDRWVNAWNDHMETWEPSPNSEFYVSSQVLNEEETLIRTLEEEDTLPYPENIQTVCVLDEEQEDDSEWIQGDEDMFLFTDGFIYCHILERDTATNTYTAEVFREDDDVITVRNIPREAIIFADFEYTADAYLRQAFRHPIDLPDDLIPETWKDIEQENQSSCKLYMAESSIPNAGLGMYSAVDIKRNAEIGYRDAVVQVEDIDLNEKLRLWKTYGGALRDVPDWLLENYYWDPRNLGAYYEADEIQSIVPGLGMLANSHTGLVNSRMIRPTIEGLGLKREEDPGAGAVSNFANVGWSATSDIPAGAEIFVEYGDSWFEHREEELGIIPLSDDFNEADRLLKEFWRKIDGNPQTEFAKKLWDFLWHYDSIPLNSRVRIALPKNLDDVERVVKIGTAMATVPNVNRNIEWLKDNGRCLDNIRPGKSTLPQAGRGAFATRLIGKDEVVAPLPMVHIHRKHLEVWDSEDVHDKMKTPWYDIDQLLRNYCYGHADSSILLFPYSPIVNYINHNRTTFNVELRWSSIENHHSDWLERSIKDVMMEDHAGVMMELVATRDIQLGEEILLDYGILWENSWEDHISTWTPPEEKIGYVAAHELNDIFIPVKTVQEQVEEPYPDNIFTACYVAESLSSEKDEEGNEVYEWKYQDVLYSKVGENTYRCDVLSREVGDKYRAYSIDPDPPTYTARVHISDEEEWIVIDIPRRAIEFIDEQYTSDMFIRTAFRHEIGIPHELFPKAWLYQ